LTNRRTTFYAGAMKLGVEAALVDGLLVRGDVEVSDGCIVEIGLASPAGRPSCNPQPVTRQRRFVV